jgi:CMP-N,N'-diacetyllegionaminic acid synthase
MKVTALITARGINSLKNKHLIKINGEQIIRYPLKKINQINQIENKIISSDDDKILEIGKTEGFITIKRPDNISKPDSLHIDAINHSLNHLKNDLGIETDILIVIMGNSVTIRKKWLEDSINIIKNNQQVTAVVPVFKNNDHHPFRAKFIDESGFLKSYFDHSEKEVSSNRQDLPPNYFICHNFWTIRLTNSKITANGDAPWKFMGKNVHPILVDKCFDIHDIEDIKEAEKWLMS